MTRDHDFKRVVRARARETGETYMQARAALERPGERRLRRLVLSARGNVDVRAVPPHAERGANRLLAEGIDISRSREPSALTIDDHEIEIEMDGHLNVDLASAFDLVIEAEGRVTVIGVGGTLDVVTTSGHVTVEAPVSDVRIDTNDGRISVRGATGTCIAVTGNGHIDVDGTHTDVELDTADGHITAGAVETGEIRTGDGHITVVVGGRGALVDVGADRVTSDVTFTGTQGAWTASLGRDPDGRALVIETGDGRVTVHDRTG